jgi:DNA-binding transcriptional LysR family regulator
MSDAHVLALRPQVEGPTSTRLPAGSDPANGVDLARVNMSLLLALDALVAERSVGRAATRMGMTQSGMSHALRQLREIFNDQLLVRNGNEMLLTCRAERLAKPLQKALHELRRALQDNDEFDPATSSRRFVIFTSDAIAVYLVPRMLKIVQKEAPTVDIDVRFTSMGMLADMLESGEVEVGVAPQTPDLPTIRGTKLLEEELVCVMRKDHPAAQRQLDIETYASLLHAMTTITHEGVGPVDTALERLGYKRRVALRINSFLSVPIIVANSDLVVTMPRRTAQIVATGFPLTLLPPPVELPKARCMIFWHERFEHDPRSRWLREVIRRAVD